MEFINENVVKNKTVLLRVDYNVPINDAGEIIDNSRIKKSLRTINFLLSNNAKVILISHFGRVKTESDIEKYSLEKIGKELSNLINKKVVFIKESNFANVKNLLKDINEDIVLLENSRIYDLIGKKESGCSEELSLFYASLADLFINDAFGASHRRHSSTYGVKKYLPSYYGFLIKEELIQLNDLVNIKKRPFTVFMGGAKVEDKLLIIKSLVKKCDYLCLGGGILNSFLKANNIDIKSSLATEDEDTLNEIKNLLKMYPDKFILSNKYIWNDNKIMDIDIKEYEPYLKNSKLIFINGTPGVFENENFKTGTLNLLSLCANSDAKVIIGGGDTASATKLFNMENSFDFISSGGGASLEYISSGKLAALED